MGLSSASRFYPELEGIRGYAFLVVFLTHYWVPEVHDATWNLPLRALIDLSWVCVPIFFVLSGFLITGILLRTQHRPGFFRVFYARRALRGLPLYYTVVLAVAALSLAKGGTPSTFFWSHLLYVQNLSPSVFLANVHTGSTSITIGHLWSLAMEEQFYLVWPIVVWLCHSKKSLLHTCFAGIVLVSAVRFFAPQLGLSTKAAYFHTATRADALLLGAALAIVHDRPVFMGLQRWACQVATIGVAVLLSAFVLTGASVPMGAHYQMTANWRVAYLIPVVNFTAAAIVLMAMDERSRLHRMCKQTWACRLGALSYACYIFHQLELEFVIYRIVPSLQRTMPHIVAVLTATCGALLLTLLLAKISETVLERPAMRWKEHFQYSPIGREAALPGPVTLGAPAYTPAASRTPRVRLFRQ